MINHTPTTTIAIEDFLKNGHSGSFVMSKGLGDSQPRLLLGIYRVTKCNRVTPQQVKTTAQFHDIAHTHALIAVARGIIRSFVATRQVSTKNHSGWRYVTEIDLRNNTHTFKDS